MGREREEEEKGSTYNTRRRRERERERKKREKRTKDLASAETAVHISTEINYTKLVAQLGYRNRRDTVVQGVKPVTIRQNKQTQIRLTKNMDWIEPARSRGHIGT